MGGRVSGWWGVFLSRLSLSEQGNALAPPGGYNGSFQRVRTRWDDDGQRAAQQRVLGMSFRTQLARALRIRCRALAHTHTHANTDTQACRKCNANCTNTTTVSSSNSKRRGKCSTETGLLCKGWGKTRNAAPPTGGVSSILFSPSFGVLIRSLPPV